MEVYRVGMGRAVFLFGLVEGYPGIILDMWIRGGISGFQRSLFVGVLRAGDTQFMRIDRVGQRAVF